MKKILLCLIIVSGVLQADFSRSSSGVVTDSVTGLEWQDDVESQMMDWQNAIDYCEALPLDGANWRLPNIRELSSIVDDTKYNPTISSVFVNTISNGYWSSTTDAYRTGYAWVVSFSNAFQFNSSKLNGYYVRCVRAGQ